MTDSKPFCLHKQIYAFKCVYVRACILMWMYVYQSYKSNDTAVMAALVLKDVYHFLEIQYIRLTKVLFSLVYFCLMLTDQDKTILCYISTIIPRMNLRCSVELFIMIIHMIEYITYYY